MMKVNLSRLVLILCSFFFLASNVFGQRGRQPKDSILLHGKIYNNKSHVKHVIINIYNYNKLFKTITVKSSNRFDTYIPINTILTVEITAEDFHAKRFMFDTKIPGKLEKIPRYDFDIDIFKETELNGVNTSLLDFPVGLVSYHKKKKEFIRNKKYTKRMKRAYLKLWAEAQAAERQGKGLE